MIPAKRFPATGAALLVVDVQEKLLPATGAGGERVVANAGKLIRAARLLDIPILATEQYPKGLGPTVPAITGLLPIRHPKTVFHAADAAGLSEAGPTSPVKHVTLVGLETHVCILQTALELLDRGYLVQVVADAVASRACADHDFALDRLRDAGAVIATTESVLFEWVGGAEHPAFKGISAIVKENSPPKPD
jgi:nicotinamidase-related amidase